MLTADMMNVIELDELREKVARFEKIEKAAKALIKDMDANRIMRVLGNGMSNDEGEVDRLEALYEDLKKAARAKA